MSRNRGHAVVLDAELSPKQGNLLAKAVVFGMETHAGVAVVGVPAPGVRQRDASEGDGVEDRRPDSLLQVAGKRKSGHLPRHRHGQTPNRAKMK